MLPQIIIGSSVVCLLLSWYFVVKTWTLYINRKKKERQILDHAEHQAQHIVTQAQQEALKIISAADVSASENNRKIDEEINQIAAEKIKDFQNNLQNISDSIKKVTSKEAVEFRKALELETTKGQKIVSQKLAEQFDQVNAEVEKYKQDKLAQVDKDVHSLVNSVFLKIAGKLVPVDQQEKLVISALEQAKKDHVF